MVANAVILNGIFVVCFGITLLAGSCLCDVEQLHARDLDTFITTNQLVLILFKSSDECTSCNKALEYFEQLPQPDLVQTELEKRYMIDESIAERLGILQYPAVVYYRSGYPALYTGRLSSVYEIPECVDWLSRASQVATQNLFDDSFEHLTQASTGATTGDWFVLFYKPGCDECMKTLPSVESAAISLKYRMNFAKVDIEINKKLSKRFRISKCPYGILFQHGKMYPYEPGKFDAPSLIAFMENWYKNVKSSPVPTEPTTFDILTESIAMYIKYHVESDDTPWMMMIGILSVVILMLVLVVCVVRTPTNGRQKHE